MKTMGIYKIQSISKPERCYIGSAININKRWSVHLSRLRRNNHHSNKLQSHFNKYGVADLQFTILLGCEQEDLIKTEQYFIDSYKPWFNNRIKAENNLGLKWKIKKGRKATDETKRILSEAKKGRKLSEEHKMKIKLNNRQRGVRRITSEATRQKMSISHIGLQVGEKHPMFGRRHTTEARIKIGIASEGRRATDETKKKMSIARTGKKYKLMSEQGRNNISIAKKGCIPWNKGLKKVS